METPESREERVCFMCGASGKDVQLTRGAAGHILCMDEKDCIDRFNARRRERTKQPLEVYYFGKDGKRVETR